MELKAMLMIKAVQTALGVTSEAARKIANSPCFQYSQPSTGAEWFSWTDGYWSLFAGTVLSAYRHPTKKHSATTVGKLGQKKSEAGPG